MNLIQIDRFERNSTPKILPHLHENDEHAIATTQSVESTHSNRASQITTWKGWADEVPSGNLSCTPPQECESESDPGRERKHPVAKPRCSQRILTLGATLQEISKVFCHDSKDI